MNDPFDFIEMKVPAKSDYVGVARLTASGLADRMVLATKKLRI